MVKKKFIDKKRSVTYSLVYRTTEDADEGPERTLMEASRGAEATAGPDIDAAAEVHRVAAATNRRYPPGHPLAWIEEEQMQEEISDERRRELVELGFPDDGYDYIKHLRTLGRGAGSLEGLPEQSPEPQHEAIILGAKTPAATKETGPLGPSVFVKAPAVHQPEEDIAVFDAAKLTVLHPTDAEEEAVGLMGGVTAFSKRKEKERLGSDRREIEELEELMKSLEADDDLDAVVEDAEEGEAVPAAGSRVLGEGDLLDDFILAATQGATDTDYNEEEDDTSEVGWSSEEEEEEEGESYYGSDDDGEDPFRPGVPLSQINGKPPPKPGSIASTYWRDERTDRKNLLGVIDERFEQLALEYDEDEIGSIEDAAEAGEIHGFAEATDFNSYLDEFLEERRRNYPPEENQEGSEEASETAGGRRRRGESILKSQLEAAGFEDTDAEVAIEFARAALRKAEEEEALGIAEKTDLAPVKEERDPTAGWDCETILTMRSNLYNHPGTITEPGRQRAAPAGMIRLNKDGIPMGVLPPKGYKEKEEFVSVKPPPVIVERKKGESAEEKKARKAAVKEAKRDARAVKKEIKSLYKQEAVKAQKRSATAQVQPSVLL